MEREREKDMKARETEAKRGLVLRGIWPVWGDRCLCVEGRGDCTDFLLHLLFESPVGWVDRCVERLHWHAGTLRAHIPFFSNDLLSSPPIIISHLYHPLLSSSPHLHSSPHLTFTSLISSAQGHFPLFPCPHYSLSYLSFINLSSPAEGFAC